MRLKPDYKIIIIFTIFLISGFLTAFNQPRIDFENAGERESYQFPFSYGDDNLDLLVILVEQVNQPQTKALGIWLISFPETSSNITLQPIYPTSIGGEMNVYSVPHEPLVVNSLNESSATNLQLLRDIYITWDEVLIIDPIGVIEVLDMVGGAELYVQYLSGALSLNQFATTWLDPQGAIHYQGQLLENLCTNGQSYSEWLSGVQFALPSSDHFKTTFFDLDIFTLIQRLVAPASNLQCNI